MLKKFTNNDREEMSHCLDRLEEHQRQALALMGVLESIRLLTDYIPSRHEALVSTITDTLIEIEEQYRVM